jgi:hypothetical protein
LVSSCTMYLCMTVAVSCEILYLLPLKYTSGFDPAALQDHSQRHGPRLKIFTDASDYEERADALFVTPKPPGFMECVRLDGDLIRFDSTTEEYAVLAPNRMIRTYYLPVPCRTIAPINRVPGNCHHEATNLAYFRRNCRRRYVN